MVANPPFSLKKWGTENAAGDPCGRVAVVVPNGVLFRGHREGRIRKKLIEENLLDAVIGLPAKLFTTTGIPVAILVFDRSREEGGENEDRFDVLFIDKSKEFTPGKKQNVMEEEHIAEVQREIDKIEAELVEVRAKMRGYPRELGVEVRREGSVRPARAR